MNPERGFVKTLHYRILAGVGLTMLCAAQDMQDIIVPNILLAVFGLWMILFPRPRVPLFFVVLLCVIQIVWHSQTYQSFLVTLEFQPFEPESLLLAGGTLLFIGCQYRLLAIRWYAAPYDPRFPQPKRRDATGQPLVTLNRPETALTPDEIIRFIVIGAASVFLGQLSWSWLSDNWTLLDFLPRFMRFAFLVWALVIGLFVGAGIIGYWRSTHQDPERARLYLQEIAWREARRDYGRIGRWMAWGKRKVLQKLKSKPKPV